MSSLIFPKDVYTEFEPIKFLQIVLPAAITELSGKLLPFNIVDLHAIQCVYSFVNLFLDLGR